jgi:hypothetical protein
MTAGGGTTRIAVVHSCGCEVFHDIGGPPRTRKWQGEQRAKKPCQACRILVWQTNVHVDNATYAMLAEEHQLPVFSGSEKQVAWATTLRGQLLDSLPAKLAELNRIAERRGHPKLSVGPEGLAVIREVVLAETVASWWIMNRNSLGRELAARHPAQFVAAGELGKVARKLLLWAGS